MGLHQSRQAAAAPKPQLERVQRVPEPCFDGFIPRSTTARAACNARRVKKLIRAGRLAQCFEANLEVDGEECPVCMEHYRRLNSTACCHQDICTECFICVVAPGGVSSRCPYCQAPALQVYLRPLPSSELPSSEADCEPEAGAAAAEGACEAAADSGAPPAAEDPPARPPSSVASGTTSSSSAARAASTASSGLSMGSLDLDGEAGVHVTAFLAPAPAAAARAAVRQHQEALRSICSPGAADGSCVSSLVPVTLSLGCDLRLLAEAAGSASRAQGPAIVAMVRRADQPGSGSGDGEPGNSGSGSGSGEAGGSGETSSSSSTEPGGTSTAGDTRPLAVSAGPDAPAAEPAPQPAAPSVPVEGGPAVLQLPDGSEQLVLLRSAQQVAEQEAAAAAAARRREEAAGAGPAAMATYQPPATAEDVRMRRAIAQADATLLQHQPPAPSRQPGDDWLERMRQADAALQAAVARRDAERFGSSGGGGGDGDGGSGTEA